jgi:hypothetical protein
METWKMDQISEHEIRVYEAAKASNRWLTAREIGVAADVADRTARAHAAALSFKIIASAPSPSEPCQLHLASCWTNRSAALYPKDVSATPV